LPSMVRPILDLALRFHLYIGDIMVRKNSNFHGEGSGSQEFSGRGSQGGGPPQRPSGRGSPMGQQQYPQGGRGREPGPGGSQLISQGGRGGGCYYQGGRGGGPQPQYQGRGMARHHHHGGGGVEPQQPSQSQQYEYRGRGGPQQPRGGMHPQQYVGGRGGSAPSSGSARPSSPELHQATEQQSTYPTPRTPQAVEASTASSQQMATSQINFGQIEQQFQQLTTGTSSVSGDPQADQAIASSKSMRFPLRPGKGRAGKICIVKANHFFVELPDKDLYQYDVSIHFILVLLISLYYVSLGYFN